MGKGARIQGKRTTSDQEEGPGGLALPSDAQAHRKRAGDRGEAEDHSWRGAGSTPVLGRKHELRGAHQPHLAAHERQVGEEDVLGYSKKLKMLVASSIWEDAVYNLGRALKTLRIESPDPGGRRWIGRSPAMAAGLTDHIWQIEELLSILPLPATNT